MANLKTYTYIIVLLMLNGIAQAGSLTSPQNNAVVEKQADKDYFCPMHPAVVSGTAGKCPKCGMDLEKKTADSQSPLIALLDKPTFEKQYNENKVQAWILTSAERKSLVTHFRETTEDSIIKNRLSDSAFMNMMLKGTHHMIVRITDKDGKEIGDVVQVQIKTPSNKKISNTMNALLEYFESSITLSEKGTHKFKLIITNKGKTKETDFNHDIE